MELEWDKLSMVDDVVAELRCHSLPDEYLIELAAQDDVYNVAAEGIDLQLWGRNFVIIDADNEVEEVEVETCLDNSDYEEENALWIHSDEADEDEDEDEAEAPTEFLSGLHDEPMDNKNDHEEVNEELRPQSLVISCHDENVTHQHCGDVSAALYGPSGTKTELIDVLPADVFGPTIENVCSSRQREMAFIEDSLLFCPQASSTVVLEVPPTFTPDPLKLGQECTALSVDVYEAIENTLGPRRRETALIEDSPLFCPQASSTVVLEVLPTYTLDPPELGRKPTAVPVDTYDVFGLTIENTLGLRQRETALIQDGPGKLFCPPRSGGAAHLYSRSSQVWSG
jgi:hypothetical protein